MKNPALNHIEYELNYSKSPMVAGETPTESTQKMVLHNISQAIRTLRPSPRGLLEQISQTDTFPEGSSLPSRRMLFFSEASKRMIYERLPSGKRT